MGIFDIIKKNIFSVNLEDKLMKTITKPVFVKAFNDKSEEVIKLKGLLGSIDNEEAKKKVENEINIQKHIHDSFSRVYGELKNSPVPFYGVHDINLEHGETKTKIDFLLVTNQFCCIINCKTLKGNIQIDSQGGFSRWVKKGYKSFKEGIYSPVEENKRAESMIKYIANNVGLEKLPIFSLTVFTSLRDIIYFKNCSEDFMETVIKANLLNAKIRGMVKNAAATIYEESKAKSFAEILKHLDLGVRNECSSEFV